ncbi:MAG: hypothetical protein IIX52_02545 [Paludibacteraceae bacterium]|nr:hypothetical protein [Paludibacteraceae bacterium]
MTYDGEKNLFKVPNGALGGSGDKNNWDKYTYTAEYKILGVGGDWTWENGLIFGPHPDANNKNEVLYPCLEVKESEAIKVVKNGGCYYGEGCVKDGSVSVTYDDDGNIVLPKGVYDLYFDKTTNQLYIGYAVPTKYLVMGVGNDWTTGIEMTENKNNADEYMLTGQCFDKSTDAIKFVKEYSCGAKEYFNAVNSSSTASYTYNGDGNIVLETGAYDFYFSKSKNETYIGKLTPSACYITGIGGNDNKIKLSLNDDKTEFVSTQAAGIQVKSTDKVKVRLEWSCGASAEYVALDDASCATSSNSGITMKDGYYDFYFKLAENKLYVGANQTNPANVAYYLMGVGGDLEKTDYPLIPNPGNGNELMLLGQEIRKANDAIEIKKKTLCAEDVLYDDVKIDSPIPYTKDNNGNIVLEDGTYDFFFDKTTNKIYIGGTLNNANVVYLDPKVEDGNDWEVDEARFAVYYFRTNDDYGWVSADKCGGLYYAPVPAAYTKYDWVRIMKDGSNTWDDKWDQTYSITYDKNKPLTKLTKPSAEAKHYDSYQTTYTGICGNNYENLDCTFPAVKDTVYVHINQFVENDLCNYVFDSFEQAFAVLKTRTEICSAKTVYYGSLKEDEITLNVPVVMLVHYGPEYYRGTEKVGMSGGHINDAPAIFFRNINRDGNGKTLVVRTADPKGNRAVLVHPVIRRSTNIVLDNLDIISDKNLRDNALDIDTGEGMDNFEGLEEDYNIVPLATIENNIVLKNCFVESYGRNGIHVVGIKGIHVENNEFYTKYDFSVNQTEGEDVVDWGGTIKFINTTDVKFLRNDSEGTLATSFFIQGCQRVLLMNNVFWNDNAVSVPQLAAEGRTVANVRLVNYGTKAAEFPLKNIGIYYNTFFIKNNPSTDLADSYVKFDFFRLGGKEQPVDDNNKDNFEPKTIRFQYNNCYSYDEDIEGNNDTYDNEHKDKHKLTFYLQGIGRSTDWCQCFKYNNFWSQYDEDKGNSSSSFEIGKFCTGEDETYNLYANVSEQVCKTDPKRPGALVVKGDAMNIGTTIERDEDVSLQGADQLFNDRLNPDNSENCVRPRMSVDNSNDALSPYDHIYIEPGTINLFTSPIVGSQTTDVMVTSIKLTPKSDVNLSIVDKNDDPIADGRFAITDAEGSTIAALTTDLNGSFENKPVYVTFVRPELDEDRTYEAFLMIVPSQDVDKQLILRIPLRGHHKAALTSIPGAWTVGAFQQRVATPVDTIIWHGSHSAAWDDRNNWYKTDGSLVTCLDALTEDLTVIIPKKDSEKYVTPPAGITSYPTLPNIASDYDFKTVRDNEWSGEQVNAGSTAKVANKIVMEYGASLVGAEELNDDNERYNEAEVEFIARRNTWLLAGAVVRPWQTDNEDNFVLVGGKKQTRLACSRDYYRWHLPQVYMHEATIDPATNKATWGVEFPDLDIDLPKDRAYAIHIPDEYGYYYYPASTYNYINGTNYDPEEPIRYTFTGRFYNEDQLPTYSVEPKTTVILTNTYPANIDAVKLHESRRGTVQVYSYDDQSFNTVEDATKTAVIQAQHSFVFTPNETLKQLNIEREWLLNTEVTHRSAEVEMPYARIEMRNKANKVASNVYIAIDPAKDDLPNFAVDAPKVFAAETYALADLYVMRYDAKWASVRVPYANQPIPLGVKARQTDKTYTFGLVGANMAGQILLEDRKTETVTDLTTETYAVSDLAVDKNGVCEGRFYLQFVPSQTEEDVPTNIEEVVIDDHQITIYACHNNVTISTNLGNNLQTIIVSDMVGRHQVYKVSGRYVTLSLPVTDGVYTVRVVADNAVRTEKVYLCK